MSTDELVVAIEEFMAKYDPYGFYDTYGSWKPTEQSFEDIKKQVESKDKHMVAPDHLFCRLLGIRNNILDTAPEGCLYGLFKLPVCLNQIRDDSPQAGDLFLIKPHKSHNEAAAQAVSLIFFKEFSHIFLQN